MADLSLSKTTTTTTTTTSATHEIPAHPDGSSSLEEIDVENMDATTLDGMYKSLLQQVKKSKAAGDPQEIVGPLVQQLQRVLRQYRSVTRRKRYTPRDYFEERNFDAVHNIYPDQIKTLPRDPKDATFVLSFDLSKETESKSAAAFFKEYGFVVVSNVITSAEAATTREEIFSDLEKNHPGFDRTDPQTFDLLSSKTYGLPKQQVYFTPQILRNRQSARVLAALKMTLGTESMLVSHDRWCTYRPSHNHPEWQTRGNLHLDVHPWRYLEGDTRVEALDYVDDVDFITEVNAVNKETGPHVQGVLNLLDNCEEDGGTLLVPKFHTRFEEWVKALGNADDNIDNRNSCWVHLRKQGGGSFKFDPRDPIYKLSHRIPMRAGSMLIWNQELVHGSRPNDSDTWRVAQFIKGFPCERITADRAKKRADAVRKGIEAAGTMSEVTDVGLRVFFGNNQPK